MPWERETTARPGLSARPGRAFPTEEGAPHATRLAARFPRGRRRAAGRKHDLARRTGRRGGTVTRGGAGGIRQRGGQYHDDFYTSPTIRQWYKNWMGHLLNRTNSITGVKYKDDPAIFSWELANEPRCINANLPASGTCTSATLVNWVNEMSTYVKSQDAGHMLSVGDEGFLARNNGADWPYNAADGVDHEAMTKVANIDYGTYHLYPNGWGETADWGTQWIKDHQAAADAYGKPVILEEFGITGSDRDTVYKTWTSAVRTGTGDGWNFWILTGVDWDGVNPYPDYDGFRVMYPSSTATVLSDEAALISGSGGGQTCS
jgi:mannan endo-1,4-beta-mannosidase